MFVVKNSKNGNEYVIFVYTFASGKTYEQFITCDKSKINIIKNYMKGVNK